MRDSRGKDGFKPLGGLRPERLGLPKRLSRQLTLRRAWVDVAGEAIAARAVPRDLRRGVLEIDVADAAWARTLRDLLPTLAGRLAARYPELGLRKCRLRNVGEGPWTVEAVPDGAVDRARAPEPPRPTGSRGTPDPEALMERYLARRGGD